MGLPTMNSGSRACEERTAMSDLAEPPSDDRRSMLLENEKTERTTALGASLKPRPKLAKHPTPGAAMDLCAYQRDPHSLEWAKWLGGIGGRHRQLAGTPPRNPVIPDPARRPDFDRCLAC